MDVGGSEGKSNSCGFKSEEICMAQWIGFRFQESAKFGWQH